MKVVIDTNVLISGLYFGGSPLTIIQSWFDRSFTVSVTPNIIQEYIKAIGYFASKKTPYLEHNWDIVFPRICPVFPDETNPVPLCRDKDDDKFLYCSLRSKAQYLVTGDKDLKELNGQFDFQILSPIQFFHILRKK